MNTWTLTPCSEHCTENTLLVKVPEDVWGTPLDSNLFLSQVTGFGGEGILPAQGNVLPGYGQPELGLAKP